MPVYIFGASRDGSRQSICPESICLSLAWFYRHSADTRDLRRSVQKSHLVKILLPLSYHETHPSWDGGCTSGVTHNPRQMVVPKVASPHQPSTVDILAFISFLWSRPSPSRSWQTTWPAWSTSVSGWDAFFLTLCWSTKTLELVHSQPDNHLSFLPSEDAEHYGRSPEQAFSSELLMGVGHASLQQHISNLRVRRSGPLCNHHQHTKFCSSGTRPLITGGCLPHLMDKRSSSCVSTTTVTFESTEQDQARQG